MICVIVRIINFIHWKNRVINATFGFVFGSVLGKTWVLVRLVLDGIRFFPISSRYRSLTAYVDGRRRSDGGLAATETSGRRRRRLLSAGGWRTTRRGRCAWAGDATLPRQRSLQHVTCAPLIRRGNIYDVLRPSSVITTVVRDALRQVPGRSTHEHASHIHSSTARVPVTFHADRAPLSRMYHFRKL